MRPFARPATLILWFTYLLLSAVPFLPLLLGLPVAEPGAILFTTFILWCVVLTVLPQPRHFHWLLLPAFLILPAELYLVLIYGQGTGIRAHHVAIVLESNLTESAEVVGAAAWLIVLVVGLALAWWGWTLRLARRTGPLLQGDARVRMAVALVTLAVVWAFLRAGFGITVDEAREHDQEVLAPSGVKRTFVPLEVDSIARSWPFAWMGRTYEVLNERRNLRALSGTKASFRFHAQQRVPDATPETVILVLGESVRYDHLGINGYARDTTPMLAKESQLVSFTDVRTPIAATRQSIPVIISRKPARLSMADGYNETSLVGAYREAGFKTFWMSNQFAVGRFDNPVTAFAEEADERRFTNPGIYSQHPSYDEALLKPLARALADPAPKKLIVLHMLGSHWDYASRYPAAFGRWQPSLLDGAVSVLHASKQREPINNSYDNTILYLDWFLSKVIGSLREGKQSSALFFVSDHGESLFDPGCSEIFHGYMNEVNLHVPALAWYSEQFQQRYPDKVLRLHERRTARLSTENVFHTMLDFGNISFPGEQHDMSVLDPAFHEHQRMVWANGNKLVDYDHARIAGGCRQVWAEPAPAASAP